MSQPANMAELFERLNDLKSVFKYGQKLIPIIQSLLDFMSETVPLLENINASISESTTKIPKATNQINNVTSATELATTEILDIVDLISSDIIEIEKQLTEIFKVKEEKSIIIKKIKKLVDNKEVIKLLDKYEKLDDVTKQYNQISDLISKIKNNSYNITLSLQVQDITSQQLAAVNHLINSVQSKLASLVLNLEDTSINDIDSTKITVPKGSHFDPNANYSKSDGRQDMVDSIVSNHQTSQDEIDKLFS
ncbi:MAG: protein phosphatase CheZ [Ignavibacteriaceae bacterium]